MIILPEKLQGVSRNECTASENQYSVSNNNPNALRKQHSASKYQCHACKQRMTTCVWYWGKAFGLNCNPPTHHS